MAIANITDAWAQYDANARYWESTEIAENYLEAILYLMGHEPQAMSVAGKSFNRESMAQLRDRLMTHVEVSTSSRPSQIARVNITGLGRYR